MLRDGCGMWMGWREAEARPGSMGQLKNLVLC